MALAAMLGGSLGVAGGIAVRPNVLCLALLGGIFHKVTTRQHPSC